MPGRLSHEESCRILHIATTWFERWLRASECGDDARMTVAKLAHGMCEAAHKGALVGVADIALPKDS